MYYEVGSTAATATLSITEPHGPTLSKHAVELLLSSASESQRREPRLGCPSRVIPPLSLALAAPGHSETFTDPLDIQPTLIRPRLKVNEQCE